MGYLTYKVKMKNRNSLYGGYRPRRIYTENGGIAFDRTDAPCVDLFFQVLPGTASKDADDYFAKAWDDDPDLALKVLFNFGNVRKDGGGKNDQKNFLRAMIWLWDNYPKTFLLNVHMIQEHTSLK